MIIDVRKALGAGLLLGFLFWHSRGQAHTFDNSSLSLCTPDERSASNIWSMCQQQRAGTNGMTISMPGLMMDGWQPAIVPGTVLNSLVHNGVYPEPYFGLNNAHEQKLIPDISEVGRDFYTYWFRTEFSVPQEFVGRHVWLEFGGINYRAEVWLNGARIGELAGMFQRGLFEVTDTLRPRGTNALAVLVHPVDIPGGLADASVIEFGAEGREAGFDVAQTFAPGQLSESQHEKLFVGGELADPAVAVVTGDTFVELVFGEEVEELGEDGATFVHKVKNRRLAVEHPRRVVAELKSKKDRTARIC